MAALLRLFAWCCLGAFWIWQALMVLWVAWFAVEWWGMAEPVNSYEAGRRARASGFAIGVVLFVWAAGSVIFGAMAALMRGGRVN